MRIQSTHPPSDLRPDFTPRPPNQTARRVMTTCAAATPPPPPPASELGGPFATRLSATIFNIYACERLDGGARGGGGGARAGAVWAHARTTSGRAPIPLLPNTLHSTHFISSTVIAARPPMPLSGSPKRLVLLSLASAIKL